MRPCSVTLLAGMLLHLYRDLAIPSSHIWVQLSVLFIMHNNFVFKYQSDEIQFLKGYLYMVLFKNDNLVCALLEILAF